MEINQIEFNKKIGNILRNARKASGYTCADVAGMLTKMGLPCKTAAVNSWENGRTSVGSIQLLMLCKLYNIHDIYSAFIPSDEEDTLNEEGLSKLEDYRKLLISSGLYKKAPDNIVELPIRKEVPMYLMAVSAGTGEFLDDDNHDMVPIPEVLPKGVYPDDIDFSVRIHGESMEPKFHDHQAIWVTRDTNLRDGDIGIFYLNGDAFCKVFHKTSTGISLVSLNIAYKPISVNESDEFRIFGKVLM